MPKLLKKKLGILSTERTLFFSFFLQTPLLFPGWFKREKSLSSYLIHRLLRDLLFVSKGMRDEVSLLLSATGTDGLKFTDVFSDFTKGKKSTEVLIKESSLDVIMERLDGFFRRKELGDKGFVIGYKIKFCYFNRINTLDIIETVPLSSYKEDGLCVKDFEGVVRCSYQLVTGVRRLETYRNAFSVLTEFAEKNYKLFSACLLSGRSTQTAMQKNLAVLSISDSLRSFFDEYNKVSCVRSKSKNKDRMVLTRGFSKRKRVGVSTDKLFYKKKKKKRVGCLSAEPRRKSSCPTRLTKITKRWVDQ